jgi:RNA polymerase sigma-70 factor (ECF subfamily)
MKLFAQSHGSAEQARQSVEPLLEAAALSEDEVDLFARLLASHQQKLYRVAYRMTGHHEDAEDLLQDALLEAYRSFRKFQRGTFFEKWLYRIMTNTFIDRQRRQRRIGPTQSLDAPIFGAADGAENLVREIPDWESDPARQVLHNVLDEPLQAALSCLQAEFRMVLILSDVEGFSYEEISEIMGTPVGTVRSRLHRARAAVKNKILLARDII